MLDKGERVHSIVFDGGEEKIVHILGCPKCLPDSVPETGLKRIKRICPVCHREPAAEGFVVGRMWSSGRGEKIHLHVIGCTNCSTIAKSMKGRSP